MSLQDRLLRSILLSVGVAVLTVSAPVLVLIVVHLLAGPRTPSHDSDVALGFGALLTLSVISFVAARRVGRREAKQLAHPFAELAAQADSIGRRRSHDEPFRSDIAEIDAVSQVLRSRAHEMTARLADEHEFAADASHQLRTPLTALLIRLEEISLLDDPEEMRHEAQIGIDQVERLTRVVDDVLRRSRTASGEPQEVTSLDSVLASLQREWQPAFSKARRSVKISGERGLRLQVGRDDLSQMISTLLENALQHGRGLVELNARRTGPSVVIEVTDEGRGVDPDIAPHVFERRVSTNGTGLGLALARDLAQSNGGRLELLDSQPARFALFLSEAGVAIERAAALELPARTPR